MSNVDVTDRIAQTIERIRPLDAEALTLARQRQDRLTKPPGSLGDLEAVSIQLAGLAGQCPPPFPAPAAVTVFAADHGVIAQGVSPWPQDVTVQMTQNFLAGGAGINTLSAQMGATVAVVDVGIAQEIAPSEGLISRRVRNGTADFSVEPAMTRQEALAAVEVGIDVAESLIGQGFRCLLVGDMGIGNTTPSSALIAVFTGQDPDLVSGCGSGVDETTRSHKAAVIRGALALHRPDPADPVGVLAAVGGLEHAAMVGYILAAAAHRIPLLLDGVIAGSAALVARALSPASMDACIAGHRSAEPGHSVALQSLGLRPLVDLGLRLGEGTGAVLALPLVQAAVRTLRDMATFESAGVSEKDDGLTVGGGAVPASGERGEDRPLDDPAASRD
ncbi:MAG: nicotinate-nucleotide--dimethylbenzimidazole phosphoribosyltransferase [Actinomycetota bacterium]|nr:nicotinate-nucleotide--dimethylbenzimidazole phosphoribosyltransferase [Actinomycetota bacterium]